MATIYEQLVEEDLNLGISTATVTMPAGGTQQGNQINLSTLADGLRWSATYDPPSLADGAGAVTTLPVVGAAVGDFAMGSFSNDLQGVMLHAWVSGVNTVSVRFQNETGGIVDLLSGIIKVMVFKTPAF